MTYTLDDDFFHGRERLDNFGLTRSTTSFPSLSDDINDIPKSELKPLNICIITQDFIGPNKNGGIGTAFTYSALELAKAGHTVTVLYTLKKCDEQTLDYWQEYYENKNINFVPITEPEIPTQNGPTAEATKKPHAVFDWLKNHEMDFNIVHVSDWNALGYFCLQAKKTGLYFQNIEFIVKCSSPTLWNRIGNATPIDDVKSLALMHMERKCVELADYAICGSQYLLNWMEDQGYALPKGRTFVQPNIYPANGTSSLQLNTVPKKINELVFFGRLEAKKGLHIFVDALVKIKSDLATKIQITLLGKRRTNYFLKVQVNRLTNAGYSVNVIDDNNQSEALAYLKESSSRLAVMPAVMDNSPLGIYECLANGIPFITSSSGGAKELIAEKDKSRALFEPSPASLSSKLKEIMSNGAMPINSSFDFDQNISDWLNWHHFLSTKLTKNKPELNLSSEPLVSVCIAHHDRGKLLLNAIETVQQQTYRNIEVLIIDDGSTKEAALETLKKIEQTDYELPVSVVRQTNKYLGAVRNTAIANAQGKYILFMDDDNEAKPHEVETFLKVAEHTDADILTCWSDAFNSERPNVSKMPPYTIAFYGNDLATGLIRNPFGDSNCFVNREAMLQIKGFTEHYKVGLDDMEFFSRSILSGLKVMLVPEALYWYRINEVRMRSGQYNLFAGRYRVLESYTQGIHPDLANIIRYASSMGYVHGPWHESPSAISNNEVPAQRTFMEFCRRVVAKYPMLYPVARRLHRIFG